MQAPAPAADGTIGLPQLPGADAPLSRVRAGSAVNVTVDGDGYAGEGGGGNYSPGGGVFVIIPGGDQDLAYAQYNLPFTATTRPITLSINADPAAPQGSTQNVPLEYWLGLADFTEYRWEWRGPYTGDASVQLNSTELRERYVSAAGTMSYVVFTTPGAPKTPENPDGLNGVAVRTSVTGTSDTYFATKPHLALVDSLAAGDGKYTSSIKGLSAAAVKRASALDPSQYVTVTWEHVQALNPEDQQNEAFQYQVFRQGSLDPQPVPIGSELAPEERFVDPLDNASVADPPIPGETYEYFVRAINPNGFTPLNSAGFISVPLLPPSGVSASDGAFDDHILVKWTKAEGATSYRLYRDGVELAELGNVSQYEDFAVPDVEDHLYELESINPFATSARSEQVAGHMLQAIESYTLTDVLPPIKDFPTDSTFRLAGDWRERFVTGRGFDVTGTPENDGYYACSAPSTFSGGYTTVTVANSPFTTTPSSPGNILYTPYILMMDAGFNPVTNAPVVSFVEDGAHTPQTGGGMVLFEFDPANPAARPDGWVETFAVSHGLFNSGVPAEFEFAPNGDLGVFFGTTVPTWQGCFTLRQASGVWLPAEVLPPFPSYTFDAGWPTSLDWNPVQSEFGLVCRKYIDDTTAILGYIHGQPQNWNEPSIGVPNLATASVPNYDFAFDSLGNPYIIYIENPDTPLMGWYYYSGTWTTPYQLDTGACYGLSVAAGANGKMFILYEHPGELRLCEGLFDEILGWQFTHAPIAAGLFSGYLKHYQMDLAVDAQDQPHIIYPSDTSGQKVWYKYRDAGGSWQAPQIPLIRNYFGQGQDYQPDPGELDWNDNFYIDGRHVALALDQDGKPLCVYNHDLTTLNVKRFR